MRDLLEAASYFFYKRRLAGKLRALHEVEDPWSGVTLSVAFAPFIRGETEKLAEAVRRSPVLDAGGGEGYFYLPVRDLVGEYHLLDMEREALARARKNLGRAPCKLIHASLDAFRPAPETYGAIWLFSILTYLGAGRYPRIFQKTLRCLWAALKPGGLVLLIHPYYSPLERDALIAYADLLVFFGATILATREERLASQTFLLQSLQKP